MAPLFYLSNFPTIFLAQPLKILFEQLKRNAEVSKALDSLLIYYTHTDGSAFSDDRNTL